MRLVASRPPLPRVESVVYLQVRVPWGLRHQRRDGERYPDECRAGGVVFEFDC